MPIRTRTQTQCNTLSVAPRSAAATYTSTPCVQTRQIPLCRPVTGSMTVKRTTGARATSSHDTDELRRRFARSAVRSRSSRNTVHVTPDEIAARPAPKATPGTRARSIGVALSGGGYRAMLYHLGALRRLNEFGLLSVVERFSMVSGGALVGAVLATHWPGLAFGRDGVAARFEDVERDVFAIADRTIDIGAAVKGRIPGTTPGAAVARALRLLIGDHPLTTLPTEPRFTFNSTNLSTGTLFRWAPEYAADYATGMIVRPELPLAEVVAASAAFPPWLSPIRLVVPGTLVDPETRNPILDPPTQLSLTDGGVYDNLGLEPLKSFHTVLSSDGGAALPRAPRLRADPLSQAIRAAFVASENQRRQRRRGLVEEFTTDQRLGALWTINTPIASYPAISELDCPQHAVQQLAQVKTRLRRLPDTIKHRLANWGYASADIAVRCYVEATLPPARSFPYPGGVT